MKEKISDKKINERFGLVYGMSENMRIQLVCLLVVCTMSLTAEGKAASFRLWNKLINSPFDKIIKGLRNEYDGKIPDMVADAKKERDYLAHNFWIGIIRQGASRRALDRLDVAEQMFRRVTDWAVTETNKQSQKMGIYAEVQNTNKYFTEMGYEAPAWPSRDAVNLAKKMEGRPQILIRVWEHDLACATLFQLEDGSVWLPGECGLTITDEVDFKQGWKEADRITPFLPAEIYLRPQG